MNGLEAAKNQECSKQKLWAVAHGPSAEAIAAAAALVVVEHVLIDGTPNSGTGRTTRGTTEKGTHQAARDATQHKAGRPCEGTDHRTGSYTANRCRHRTASTGHRADRAAGFQSAVAGRDVAGTTARTHQD